MAFLILTVIGPDRPGLVNALAAAVAGRGGSWLESRMARLAGQFAGIVRVEAAAGLEDDLHALENQGLRIVVQPAAAEPVAAGERLTLEVVGNDRPGIVRSSPIAGPAGFIDVDQSTLRHCRFPNIYALGDACSTPNAKTMAAARKQAPIVAVNVLATLAGREPTAIYDGYGSCPLTVERGKIVLAEFGYGGKVIPSFPSWLIDGSKPSRAAWFLKARVLPSIYWDGMLKGREWLAHPHKADGGAA